METKRVVRLCCLSTDVIRKTLRELTPDGGVSIRTSRQLMNVHYGNHRNDNIICFCGNHLNLFDALIMASVFTDNVAL